MSGFKPSLMHPHTAVVVDGLTGATAASRYVGATASGAPAAGTFAVGDYVVAQDGAIYVCTVAGTPGTWASVAGGGSLPTGTTKGDLAVFDGTNWVRVGAGADGTVFTADSAQTAGVKWAAGGGGGTAFSGALVRKSANQTIAADTLTAIAWDVEAYDTDGFHDNVTNNDRLTVHVDGTYVFGTAHLMSGGAATTNIFLELDGTTLQAAVAASSGSGTFPSLAVVSPPLVLTAGQYVTSEAYVNGVSRTVVADTRTHFWCYRVA